MNKVFLITKREFLTRVRKRTFLIATILTPLLFPAIIGGIIYLMVQEENNQEARTIEVFDPGNILPLEDNDRFRFVNVSGDSTARITAFLEGDHYGHLEINQDKGKQYRVFTKSSFSLNENNRLENIIEGAIRQQNLDSLQISNEVLAAIRPQIDLNTFNIKDQKQSNSGIAFAIGYGTGFLIYMFLFVYGAQVMQGVIEEKTNKIVEIIIATVKPFQLMLGKVLGIASVGLLQLTIWIVLIAVFSFTIFSLFGVDVDQANSMSQAANQMSNVEVGAAQEFANSFYSIPFTSIILTFLFYFLGGYLLYGALFAAVGSAVDSPSDAQQFMFPITIPLIASIIGLTAVLQNPDGNLAFWLSIIPLTSPITMMGRIGFGMPPLWELLLSMTLLVAGFVGAIWLAGRIYRIGILMHGTKVNYKVLVRWLMMKN